MNSAAAYWHQTYSLFNLGIGFSALIAGLPIFILLFLLGVMKKQAWFAGVCGLGAALLLATLGYGMPVKAAISAAAYGGAFGLFPICWIIFWAIALFRVTVETGKFEVIRDSIGHLTPDPRMQALLVAFCFGAFLEGAAGFGTPVAVAAAMLTGLGFPAFGASAICLLANTVPVAFGALGTPVFTIAGATGLPLDKLSWTIALLCSPAALILPVYLLIAVGGFAAMSRVWIPTLTAGFTFAAIQLVVARWVGPQLSSILAALASMSALIVVLKLRPRSIAASDNSAQIAFSRRFGIYGSEADPKDLRRSKYSFCQILSAWMPYMLLVVCVLLWTFGPVESLLNRGNVSIQWPWLHDVVQRMPPISSAPSPYHALFSFNFLPAAGTACMAATFLAAVFLRVSFLRFLEILATVLQQLALPIATVVVVLGIGFLMNYCGATATLGLAFASTKSLFPFFSPFLGLLGVFLTGSDTASNALFGGLQLITAGRLGLDPVLMVAANAAGGVMGKMISVQTIAVAAAATGLSVPDQASLFRFTLKHSILLGLFLGGLVVFYSYALRI